MLRETIQQYYQDVEMPGGYRHNLPETLRMIELYYHGKFKSGQFDSKGFRKFFYNIVKPACDIATKFIDLDTKDFTLIPEDGTNERKVWLMQKDLKQWLKNESFGDILNETGHDYPKYGTVCLKTVKGHVEKTEIANLRMNPSIPKLEDGELVAEVHRMSEGEIMDMPWDEDAVKELFSRGSRDEYIIYEEYKKEGKKWKQTIKGDVFTKLDEGTFTHGTEALINNDNDELIPELILAEATVSKLPYDVLKWEDLAGRFLGMGFVEYLEDNQVATNEAENLERKGLHYTSLKVYQTRDSSIGGSNILTDVENGDILKSESEITPIAMEERNGAAYNSTRQRWGENTERKTFSFDVARGENLPSRTPLGVANLSAGMVSSYFELKREKFGLFLKPIFLEEILPSFANKSSIQHTVTFLSSDDEIDKLDKMIMEVKLGQAIRDYTMKTGFAPAKIQVEDLKIRIEDKVNRQINRYVDIPTQFYTNAKYLFDMLITGESMDVGAKSGLITTTLQLLFSNPQALQNKGIRSMMFKLLEMGGVSPVGLNMDIEDTPMQQGGSVAGPGQPTAGSLPTSQAI